ncbi:cytochrome P450 [Nocardioidaceae bacterium]|nr:cytochrome P450 [Nocardioidaceae bacterium]
MTISGQFMSATASVVPMHWQVRAAHLVQKSLDLAGLGARVPTFTETPLPDAAHVSLADIDLSNPFLWRQQKFEGYAARLRAEQPVHHVADSPFGAFWSVTRHADIMYVDKHHDLFSAEPIITLGDQPKGLPVRTFIAMDPPEHDAHRRAVQGVVAPRNLQEMEALIRERTTEVLDGLPVGEPFDWVERVSIELTARMLVTLLDFPYERRHELVVWSDLAAASPETTGGLAVRDDFFPAVAEVAKAFSALWRDKEARIRAGEEPGFDLMSLMITDEDTKDLIHRPMEFLGNLALLIVGGNDTTRNSMSGGILAMSRWPDQLEMLKADRSLIPNAVSEIIRWQTPLAYMRRVATQDVEVGGVTIRKGDKVVMWYASGNRDEEKFPDGDRVVVDRKNARNHVAFGYGIHRCMGNRLAELQLKILWEELLTRFDSVEVVEEPERVQSNFVRGYSRMMVRLTPVG